MQLNQINNVNFKGDIIVHNKHLGDYFNIKVKENPFLRDIAGNVSEDIHVCLRRRSAASYEIFKQGRDEELFRVIFKLKKPVRTIFDKIVNFFSAPSIPLTSKYHSEATTLSLLANKEYLAELFKKHIKHIKK